MKNNSEEEKENILEITRCMQFMHQRYNIEAA